MDAFHYALASTFHHEGGYADVAADRGGPTNMGVTLATMASALGTGADLNHDGRVDAADVRLLTRVQAESIYRELYWWRPGLHLISDARVAAKTFDIGVNAGPPAAVILLQRAINAAAPPGVQHLVDDGRLGPKTLAALDACDPVRVLDALRALQRSFYLRCIEVDPTQAQFRANWLARADWIPEPMKGVA